MTQATQVRSRVQEKDKTTPRPWALFRSDDGDHCIVSRDPLYPESGGVVIATLDSENAEADLNAADGEVIVAAVNERERLRFAHDKLYVACRTAYDLLQNISSESFSMGGDRAVRDVLSEAIDQAELNGI